MTDESIPDDDPPTSDIVPDARSPAEPHSDERTIGRRPSGEISTASTDAVLDTHDEGGNNPCAGFYRAGRLAPKP